MIRLLRGVVQQYLLILAYLQDRGYSMTDVRRSVTDEWGGRPNPHNKAQAGDAFPIVQQALMNLEDGSIPEESLPSLFETVVSVLKSKGKVPGDLIDMLVDVLKGPHARSVLSGQTLILLRKVLLLPEETAGLIERLKKREMSCVNCGHDFLSGEAASVYAERDMTALYCYSCYNPSWVKCYKCMGSAPIPAKFRDGIQGVRTCEDCKNPKKKEEEEKKEEGGEIAEGGLFNAGMRGIPILPRAGRARAGGNEAMGIRLGREDIRPPNLQALAEELGALGAALPPADAPAVQPVQHHNPFYRDFVFNNIPPAYANPGVYANIPWGGPLEAHPGEEEIHPVEEPEEFEPDFGDEEED